MSYYNVEVPNIASEVFDSEIVIADFVGGSYFSVGGSGALIWQGLRAGHSSAEIAGWLANHYGRPHDEIGGAVEAFVADLLQSGLIQPVDPASLARGELPVLGDGPFAVALLERFDDLRDLLLLDPVHDVAEAGWPHLPEKA